MSLTMRVDGADRSLRFDWKAASEAWAAEVRPGATQLMKAHAPMGAGPTAGAMRQGIASRLEPGPSRMWVVLYSTAPYAKYVLGGTRAHTIRVRNAKALRWIPNRGHGSPRYAIQVQHPGTKPNNFPERAIAPMRQVIMRAFTDAVKEATIVD